MAEGSEQRDWSLGLSDDEDTDAEAIKIIGNEDELNDELSDVIKFVIKCQFGAKILDIKQQQIQQSLTLGLSSLALITNTIVNSKESIPKEVLSSVVKQAMDGANILGDHFQAISSRRRFEMKRHLNPEYGGICSQQFPSSEWLFGTDLAESLKSTKATSTLMRSTMNRGGRYHPYSQPRPTYQSQNQSRPSLNWGRPQQSQFRGRGEAEPAKIFTQTSGTPFFQPEQSIQSIPKVLNIDKDKCDKIITKCRSVSEISITSIQRVAELVGSLVAASPATRYGMLYTSQLEIEKSKALVASGGRYSGQIILSPAAKMDIQWWIGNIKPEYRSLTQFKPTRVIYSDSSPLGWGAVCNGQEARDLDLV
ncbi:hypothetical protein Fcan01_25114 [Folsomia candida]|uniref:Uncharacterized protein n=1 Tax=Folsomia candida TaxID=158441 RepID=A0A226D5R5_FOLCA|nr:hypothetical protein Fcan01_25114 [Folsomia candida]